MRRLVCEARCHFFFDTSFTRNWAAYVPFGLLCAKVSGQPCGYVFFGIPDRHQLHVLDRRVLHSRVVVWLITPPDSDIKRANRPLNRGAGGYEFDYNWKPTQLLPSAIS